MLCRDLVHNSVSEGAEAESDCDMEIDVVGLDLPAKTGDVVSINAVIFLILMCPVLCT